MAFADYAAELDVANATSQGLSPDEVESRRSRASLMILDELEFESNVVTMPLVFAVVVAAMSQFLVGYNTGVMNAPAKVVFPGHSTLSWSLAVSAFAVGGPFGAISTSAFAPIIRSFFLHRTDLDLISLLRDATHFRSSGR
jgi:hypothetical protein